MLWRVFAGLPAYVWSGWGAAASLLLLLTAWEAVAALYDPLILPDPLTAFAALWAQVEQGAAWPALWATARRALMGLALALGVGSVLGLLAGLSGTASVLASSSAITATFQALPSAVTQAGKRYDSTCGPYTSRNAMPMGSR